MQKIHFIKKDLLMIFLLMIILFASMAILAYVDSTQHMVSAWANTFYHFLLRS